MSWQKTKPQDDDKIKDSAADLRGNFAAIEDGEVPFSFIQVTPGSAPSESGQGLLYAKSSDNEMYVKNAAGTETQLTKSGQNPFTLLGYGSFDSDGSTLGTAFNLTCSHTAGSSGTGKYTLNFTTNVANSSYVAIANADASTGKTVMVMTDEAAGARSTSSFNLIIKDKEGAKQNVRFNVAVFGDA